ncbi:GNAT family N-acetyltransferase [Streptomyces sp. NPDC087420]|uniref:GNAT family N-acetyltransferase n=1 Tax=Streptomyces sp. NPDC087420 TaxID=3365785 RepID=UPI0038388612
MVQISVATEEDTEIISEILGEIEAYYGGEATPGNTTQIRAALFSGRPAAQVLLARDSDQVLGFASYTFLWPAAGAESSLYLKELFVRSTARRRGVAKAFMAALEAAAAAAGCSRIEWTPMPTTRPRLPSTRRSELSPVTERSSTGHPCRR